MIERIARKHQETIGELRNEIERLRKDIIVQMQERDKAADEIERLREEQRHIHVHMNHLRTGLSALRKVADVARDLVEECRPGIAPSLGVLARLEDALHTEWKT